MGYYLIARDKTSNDFKILELKSKWYLKNGTDALNRSNKLEVIDLLLLDLIVEKRWLIN